MITKNQFSKSISPHAFHNSEMRKLLKKNREIMHSIHKTPSSLEEMEEDWKNACDFIILHYIEKVSDFSTVDSDCYKIFERSWYDDIKKTKAYLIYCMNNFTYDNESDNYSTAIYELRNYLYSYSQNNDNNHTNIINYLKKEYLSKGKIDTSDKNTHELIARKAERICKLTNYKYSDKQNWGFAEYYVCIFYNNIIPAIETRKEIYIKPVLNALTFSKYSENGFFIINSFEALVSIWFLDKMQVNNIASHTTNYNFNITPTNNGELNNKLKSYFSLYKELVISERTLSSNEIKDLNKLTVKYSDIINNILIQNNIRYRESIL